MCSQAHVFTPHVFTPHVFAAPCVRRSRRIRANVYLARMRSFDPSELARAQLDRDKLRTQHMPSLFARKVARMRASAVGFLRGAAPLYYELCADDIAEGPPGEGWIAGDLHVE